MSRSSKSSSKSPSKKSVVYHAPIPFDVYLNSVKPAVTFHNNSSECTDPYIPKHNPTNLMIEMMHYADIIGIGGMLDKGTISLTDKLERIFTRLMTAWQSASFDNNSRPSVVLYDSMKKNLPLLKKPIVLYRGYEKGIDEPPEIGAKWDMGLRSCSLSQGFADKFFASKATAFVARVDVLPGQYVLPLLSFGQDGLLTEFEVVVNGMRVHVVDPTLILEGQTEMPPPPMDYRCEHHKYTISTHTRNLKKVKFFFILSEPGTDIEYYPNFMDKKTKLKIGGGKALHLNDNNKLGVGNSETIIRDYMARHKNPRKKTHKRRSMNVP